MKRLNKISTGFVDHPVLTILLFALLSIVSCERGKEQGVIQQQKSTSDVGERSLGVTVYDSSWTYDGFNSVSSARGTEVYDMAGDLVFKFPGWIGHIFENGDFIAMINDNPDSGFYQSRQHPAMYNYAQNIIWEKNMDQHHGTLVQKDSLILIMSSEYHSYQNKSKVRFDVLTILNKKGQEVLRWSSFEHLDTLISIFHAHYPDISKEEFRNSRLIKMPNAEDSWEFTHNNYFQIIPENKSGKIDNRFRSGNLLVNLHPYCMVIMDTSNYEILWSYSLPRHKVDGGAEVTQCHTTQMLPNGHILLFDNGEGVPYSLVKEIDPISEKIVWQFPKEPDTDFKGPIMSSCYRLPNGNTLITESKTEDGDNAVEVTPGHRIVWKWINPNIDHRTGDPEHVFNVYRFDKGRMKKIMH